MIWVCNYIQVKLRDVHVITYPYLIYRFIQETSENIDGWMFPIWFAVLMSYEYLMPICFDTLPLYICSGYDYYYVLFCMLHLLWISISCLCPVWDLYVSQNCMPYFVFSYTQSRFIEAHGLSWMLNAFTNYMTMNENVHDIICSRWPQWVDFFF